MPGLVQWAQPGCTKENTVRMCPESHLWQSSSCPPSVTVEMNDIQYNIFTSSVEISWSPEEADICAMISAATLEKDLHQTKIQILSKFL